MFPSEPHHSSLSIFASAPRLAVASVYAHRQASESFSFYQPARALQLANYTLPSSLPGDLLLEQQSNKVKKQLRDPGHSTTEVDDPSPCAAQGVSVHIWLVVHTELPPQGAKAHYQGCSLFPLLKLGNSPTFSLEKITLQTRQAKPEGSNHTLLTQLTLYQKEVLRPGWFLNHQADAFILAQRI